MDQIPCSEHFPLVKEHERNWKSSSGLAAPYVAVKSYINVRYNNFGSICKISAMHGSYNLAKLAINFATGQ